VEEPKMSPSPVITTIIPTFRRPDKLKKAIQSVLNQTYPHVRVCIYDNASGDETAQVALEFTKTDQRVQYHCHDCNIGAAQNFQYGLSRVDTPFFSFLSDDDFLLPTFYAAALNGFDNHPDAYFFSGAVIDVTETGKVVDIVLSKWPARDYYSPPEGLLEMIGKYSNWTGVLFRREILQKIGTLDLNLKAIDVDYLLRAARQTSFVISKQPCAVFVQHSSSYSKNNGLKLIYPGWDIMREKIQKDPKLSLDIKLLAQKKLEFDLHHLLFLNALKSLESKKFEEAASTMEIFNQRSDQKYKKLLLLMAIETCRTISFVHRLFVLLVKMKRFWKRRIILEKSIFIQDRF
jgi:glycosyltransferase involved in cell wall biosynthesis